MDQLNTSFCAADRSGDRPRLIAFGFTALHEPAIGRFCCKSRQHPLRALCAAAVRTLVLVRCFQGISILRTPPREMPIDCAFRRWRPLARVHGDPPCRDGDRGVGARGAMLDGCPDRVPNPRIDVWLAFGPIVVDDPAQITAHACSAWMVN
jgi:hypothetical protein